MNKYDFEATKFFYDSKNQKMCYYIKKNSKCAFEILTNLDKHCERNYIHFFIQFQNLTKTKSLCSSTLI